MPAATSVSPVARSVASTPWGFVAVGDSVTASGLRGLAVAVDVANLPIYVRRLGGSATTTFAAVVADSNGVRVAVTSQLDHADLARLDALGNIAKQVVVFQGAEAQGLLALDDGGALLLATDLWAAGGAVRLARLSSTDAVLWTSALLPPDANLVARASDLALLASGIAVPGQYHAYAAPQQTQPWLARFALADGQKLGVAEVAALPASAQLLATAVAAKHLWVAGESLGAPNGAWLARAELDGQGLPQAVTVVATAAGPAAWSGLAALADGVVMAGYQTGDGLDFALRRQSMAGPVWTLATAVKGKQLLQGVAVLPDGTVLGVGGREIKGGGEAVWVRVAGDGAVSCL